MKREIDENGNIIIRGFTRNETAKPWDPPGLYVRDPIGDAVPASYLQALLWRIEESAPILFAAALFVGLLSLGVLSFLNLSGSDDPFSTSEVTEAPSISTESSGNEARILPASSQDGFERGSGNPADGPRLPAAALGISGDLWRATSGGQGADGQGLLATPNVQMSTLQVRSEPAGGTVMVDFDSVGTTPMSLQLARGVYVLSVAFPEGERRDSVVILEDPTRRVLNFVREAERQDSPIVARRATDNVVRQEPTRRPPTSTAGTTASEPSRPAQTSMAENRPNESTSNRDTPPIEQAPAEQADDRNAQVDNPMEEIEEEVAGTATISVRVKPWGSIFVDGRLLARNTDLRHAVEVEPGTHRLRVEHPALGSHEIEVTVRPGMTLEVPVDLLSISQ